MAFRRQLVSHLQLQDIPKDDRTDVRKIMRKMDAVGQPVEPMAAHLMLLGVRARRSEQGSGAATTGDEKGGAAKAAATKAKDMEREPDSERVDTSGQDTRRRGKLVTISTDDYDARVSKLRSNGQHEGSARLEQAHSAGGRRQGRSHRRVAP